MTEDNKPRTAPSVHPMAERVSIEEATKRELERRRIARERDEALGTPQPKGKRVRKFGKA